MLTAAVCISFLLPNPTTWTVAPFGGPGVDFTSIEAAVSAAQSGDTILVRAGSYFGFTSTDKALTVRGEGAGVVAVRAAYHPSVQIGQTPPGATFVLSGMTLLGSHLGHEALLVHEAATVCLTDCVIEGTPQNSSVGNRGIGMVAREQSEVHASRCTFTGAESAGMVPGGEAAQLTTSRMTADQCTFRGGRSTHPLFSTMPGGVGIRLLGSSATLARCDVFGGEGLSTAGRTAIDASFSTLRIAGLAANLIQAGGSPAGVTSEVSLNSSTSTVTVHDHVQVVASPTGGAATAGPVTYAPEQPYLDVVGTSHPSGETNAAGPVAVDFDGLFPNALAVFAIADRPLLLFGLPAPFVGEVQVDLAAAITTVAVLDANGHVMVPITLTATPALLGRVLYGQGLVFDPTTGGWLLSNADRRIYSL